MSRALPTTTGSVWTIKTGRFSGHGCDRIYNLPDVSGPDVAEPVRVVPAAELVEALTHVKKLAEDLLEARDVADDLAAIVRTLRHDGDLGPQGVAALTTWETAWRHDD